MLLPQVQDVMTSVLADVKVSGGGDEDLEGAGVAVQQHLPLPLQPVLQLRPVGGIAAAGTYRPPPPRPRPAPPAPSERRWRPPPRPAPPPAGCWRAGRRSFAWRPPGPGRARRPAPPGRPRSPRPSCRGGGGAGGPGRPRAGSYRVWSHLETVIRPTSVCRAGRSPAQSRGQPCLG